MFRTTISSTPMTTESANTFFQNITGASFNGDVSFVATLRALAYPRMQEGDAIRLEFTCSSYSARDVAGTRASRMVSTMLDMGYYSQGTVVIHNCDGRTQEDNYACLELMKSTFCEVYSGFHRLEKVTDFFKKTFYVLCFINPTTKQVVLFVDSLNLRKLHYLQCAIFAFLPWYFDPEAGVSQDEMNLIQSLREKTPEQYEACLVKLSQQYDFRAASIKKMLAGFETRFDKIESDRLRRKILEIERNIADYQRKIYEKLSEKNGFDVKLLGLETKIAKGNGESEIMDYFLCNDKLSLSRVTDSQMTFAIKDYITYFDEDMAKRIIDNEHSYVYCPNGRSCNNFIEHDDMKRLMYAVFIDQTLRMRTCAAYGLSIGGSSVDAISGYDYGYEFADCIPNAHIDRYSCLGNYSRAITECLKRSDYIGAIEQCIASCKSLNFADSAVMKVFMSRMYGLDGYTRNRCIELPNGNVVTPKEAAAWLKEQQAPTEPVQEPTQETEQEEVNE